MPRSVAEDNATRRKLKICKLGVASNPIKVGTRDFPVSCQSLAFVLKALSSVTLRGVDLLLLVLSFLCYTRLALKEGSMSLQPQKFREIVLQLLYSADVTHQEMESTAYLLMAELKVTKKSVKEAESFALQVQEKIPLLDEKISCLSTDYTLDRISRVEKSVLRLGMYELLYQSVPPLVAISEAIRLTRKFGTPESAQFVNAILDRLYKDQQTV